MANQSGDTRRAIIFANGDMAANEAIRSGLQAGDLLVAADGGLHHILALGRRPDLLIGDLDSVTADDVARLEEVGVPVLRFPVDKDETDLELALVRVVKMGFHTIRVVAALGGRLDQTLGNLALLQLPELEGCDVRLEDGRAEVFLIHSTAEIVGRPGETVSLLPVQGPAEGVETDGLRYPLHGETLRPERSRGISNVLLGGHATVRLKSGVLLCVHIKNTDEGDLR